jgi:DNA invertase Pin-like site-specific DNA recombinase
MIAPTDQAFQTEDEKITYCRQFLERRGFAIQSPEPTCEPQNREPVSVAYLRASTGKQELSTTIQLERCTAGIAAAGDTVPRFGGAYEDKATSGTKRLMDRIEGKKLYQFLQGGDHLWITHFDRLGRNTLDSLQMLENFAKRGVKLHVLDFFGHQFDVLNPQDAMMVHFFCAIAKYMRDQTAQRTKAALEHLRKQGRILGWHAPPGYRAEGKKADRKFVPDYHDQKCINIAWTACRIEGWTQQKILKTFRERGVKIPIPNPNYFACGWRWHRLTKILRQHKRLPFPSCPKDTPTEVDDLKIWPAY